MSEAIIYTQREAAERMLANVTNQITEKEIQERFLQRKVLKAKTFQQPLGQVQQAIRDLKEQAEFLQEFMKELDAADAKWRASLEPMKNT